MARGVLVLLLLYLAVALCPQRPHEYEPSYDRSFVLALNLAHAQGMAFGEQLVYPYGPLGWICRPLPLSGALGLAVGVKFVVFALFLALLVLLARRVAGSRSALWCLVVVGAAGLLDPIAVWLSHLELAAPVLGLLAVASAPSRRLAPLLALAALSAALLLVKLDAGVQAIALCAAVCIYTVAQRRDDGPSVERLLLLPPVVFALALSVLFVLAPGRLEALPAFLRNSLAVIAGYKEMTIDGEPRPLLLALAASGAAFVLLPLLVRDRRRLWPALLVILVPVFMSWQRVAVRQDASHQVSFLPRLGVLLLFPLLVLQARRDRVVVALLQALVLIAAGVSTVSRLPVYRPELLDRITGRQALDTVQAIGDWEQTRRGLEQETEALGAPLRLGAQARAIVGDATVDAVPWELERVIAHRWHWTPRPALQSSNAYVPRLDGLDARHFAGSEGPRFVLADSDTIDQRHIFLEAPLSWRALLDRYDLRQGFPGVLLLERRPAPRFAEPRLLGAAGIGWDQELELPASDELVLLSCRIDRSPAGWLAGLAYRNASVHLDVRHRSGLEQRWRVVRPNLESGAIVSALPTALGGLRDLFGSGPAATDRVVSVRLHTDEPWQFAQQLEAHWWALPLREAERPWSTEFSQPPGSAAGWTMLGDDCGAEGRPVLSLTGEPRLGESLDVTVGGAPPRGVVQLLVGATAVELRHASWTFFVDPQRMLVLPLSTDGYGAANLHVVIPDQPRLAGLEVVLQAAVRSASAAQPPWRLSCGLRLVIGR